VDNMLLVQRLKCFSSPTASCKGESAKNSPLRRRSPNRRPGQNPGQIQGQDRLLLQKLNSMRHADTSRPTSLLVQSRWSNASHGLALISDENENYQWDKHMTRSPSTTRKQNLFASTVENEKIELSSPPLQPHRKASRDTTYSGFLCPSRSLPQLRTATASTTTEFIRQLTLSYSGGIAEDSILDIPDDTSVCSELTDLHSLDTNRSAESRQMVVNENKLSFRQLTSDSPSKNVDLHKRMRWDNSRKDIDGLQSLRVPKPPNQPPTKKAHLLKKTLPCI
jgi:hypothetical protein